MEFSETKKSDNFLHIVKVYLYKDSKKLLWASHFLLCSRLAVSNKTIYFSNWDLLCILKKNSETPKKGTQ